jgi:hypothetical protein
VKAAALRSFPSPVARVQKGVRFPFQFFYCSVRVNFDSLYPLYPASPRDFRAWKPFRPNVTTHTKSRPGWTSFSLQPTPPKSDYQGRRRRMQTITFSSISSQHAWNLRRHSVPPTPMETQVVILKSLHRLSLRMDRLGSASPINLSLLRQRHLVLSVDNHVFVDVLNRFLAGNNFCSSHSWEWRQNLTDIAPP